ncbi:MAG: hypothetical protein AAF744_14865, partial [Pseudomonadota bacterium]
MRDLIARDELAPTLAPFTDPNFKLAVISELIETRVLDLGDFVEFLRFIEGPEYDYEADGYAPSADAYDYLGRYPLTPDQLAQVTFLEFDGGLAIYEYVFPFWDGESSLFDIQSLADLRLLPNLERLNVVSMLQDTDLKSLRTAQRLERVSLGLTGTWENLDALLALPRLERVSLFKSDLARRFR